MCVCGWTPWGIQKICTLCTLCFCPSYSCLHWCSQGVDEVQCIFINSTYRGLESKDVRKPFGGSFCFSPIIVVSTPICDAPIFCQSHNPLQSRYPGSPAKILKQSGRFHIELNLSTGWSHKFADSPGNRGRQRGGSKTGRSPRLSLRLSANNR